MFLIKKKKIKAAKPAMLCSHQLKLMAMAISLLLACLFNNAWALQSDQNQPYIIDSDQAIYDRNHHITTYEGHVHVTQGSSRLHADKMLVYQDSKNTILHVTAYGTEDHDATYSTIPNLDKDRLYATAQQIDYDPNARIVRLIGQGHVNQGDEVFSGPHIWYTMVDGLVRSTPDETKQRTVIVLPGSGAQHSQHAATVDTVTTDDNTHEKS